MGSKKSCNVQKRLCCLQLTHFQKYLGMQGVGFTFSFALLSREWWLSWFPVKPTSVSAEQRLELCYPSFTPHSNHRTVLVQLLLNEPRTAESGESSASSSDIHMGDPDGFLGCCLQPGPALVFVDIWGVKLLDGRFFSFVSFSFNLPFK